MNHQLHRAGRGKRRNRAREQFWLEVFKHFADSGRSIRSFCMSRGLSEPSFYFWRRRLAGRDGAAGSEQGPAPAPPMFLPVRIAGAATGRMEVVLGRGRRIRLRGPVDRMALAEVVRTLESIQVGSVSC
jgi:transposase-like protein